MILPASILAKLAGSNDSPSELWFSSLFIIIICLWVGALTPALAYTLAKLARDYSEWHFAQILLVCKRNLGGGAIRAGCRVIVLL